MCNKREEKCNSNVIEMLNLIDLRNRSITIENRVESDKWKDLKDLTRIPLE